MSPPFPSPPQILISVRDAQEALLAAREGVTLIDVKEPSRGSLGPPDSITLTQIQKTLSAFPSVRISAAGGELRDFSPTLPRELHACLSYFKLGLSGMGLEPLWVERWMAAREQLNARSPVSSSSPGWIAVAYVDPPAAASPPVEDIISAAIETRCAGVLFDTYQKSGCRLTKQVPLSLMKQWLDRLRQHNLTGAVAGQLQQEDIPCLRELGADIIGFRSAACRNRSRTSELDPDQIRRLLGA